MERFVSLAMPRFRLLVLIVVMMAETALAGDERELVLAASTASSIPPLSNQETRKLYLGVPVEKDGRSIMPLINLSDRLLFEVFLQKVTFMAADAYEKRVMAIVFRLGGQRPAPFQDRQALVAALRTNPNAVTFLWGVELQEFADLKRVTTLWTGATD